MNGVRIALLLCGLASWVPRPAFAETEQADGLRLCRAQADASKRLACYDSLALEHCRSETDGANRLACYDALAERVSPHR